MWLKNTDGKKDSALTFSAIAFAIVVVKILLGGTELSIGSWEMSVKPIDADVVAALLGCTMGTYAMRRYTDKKFVQEGASEQNVGEDGPT